MTLRMSATKRACQYDIMSDVSPLYVVHSFNSSHHIRGGELGKKCSSNGLSPVRRRAITWANAVLLSIEPLETNFSQIQIRVLSVSLKMHLKLSFVKMVVILSRGDELKTHYWWCIAHPWRRPSEVISCHRYCSTMAQIMACCRTAPNHDLNQCWYGIVDIHPSSIAEKINNK